MSIQSALENLSVRRDLETQVAEDSFERLFTGQLSPAQSGALLLGLRSKGETAQEIRAAVQAALKQARLVSCSQQKTIDTCGTGGDGKKSFNCSTAVALFLADMGYNVVKHGNRAVSGNCGSADVIESLGLPFSEKPEEVLSHLQTSRFAFLFAPNFHPAFASIAGIRQELGIPTLFNLLGPLLNPARPSHQLLGVGKAVLVPLIADVLAMSGITRAAVVHSHSGFDELTPCGPADVALIDNGQSRLTQLDPRKLGLPVSPESELIFPEREETLRVMRAVLAGKGPEAVQNMVALNLGLALHLLEEEMTLQDAVTLALDTVRRGTAGGRPDA